MFRNCLSKSRFYLKNYSVKASCTLFLSIKKGHFISIKKKNIPLKNIIYSKKKFIKKRFITNNNDNNNNNSYPRFLE